MKKDVHPDNYRLVVFQDVSNGFTLLTRSTAVTDETIKWEDGHEYPLVKTHISSASHPFYTGQEKLVDVEGRVDRFKARRKAAEDRQAAAATRRAKKQPKAAKQSVTKQKPGDASADPSPETAEVAAKVDQAAEKSE